MNVCSLYLNVSSIKLTKYFMVAVKVFTKIISI